MSQDNVERLFGADKSHQYWVGGQALQPSVQVTRPAPRSPVPVQKSWIKGHPYMATIFIGLALALGFGGLWLGFVLIGAALVVGTGVVAYTKASWKQLSIVQRGVPTPQAIRDHFVQTQGREPTIAEVNDLHAMLMREHNQALIGAAILGAGLYGANRAVNHKPLL